MFKKINYKFNNNIPVFFYDRKFSWIYGCLPIYHFSFDAEISSNISLQNFCNFIGFIVFLITGHYCINLIRSTQL